MLVPPLKDIDFTGATAKVLLNEEVKSYTFAKRAGTHGKSAAWQVQDAFDTPYAIKLVPKSEYKTHSIEAELKRAKRLTSRFAKIDFYGEPRFVQTEFQHLQQDTYAIVVEWIEGETLDEFCVKRQAELEINQFMELAADLCEILALLNDVHLCHNDLHENNIMVVKEKAGPGLTEKLSVRVIDTGSLMTVERRTDLIENWNAELGIHESNAGIASNKARVDQLKYWLNWFSRTDQEWVVAQIVRLANVIRLNASRLPVTQRVFFEQLPAVLKRMIDPDHSMRLQLPMHMFQEIDLLWKRILTPPQTKLMTPFDFISAELIRSDGQLNDLFSEKCPWLERCATTDPVYIYGPRGCGKSTILRKLSLPALFAGDKVKDRFWERPYIGVYISCASELRSRFWLYPAELYPKVQGDLILFFICLLVEALLETLELLHDGVVESRLERSVGLSTHTAREIWSIVCEHFTLKKVDAKLAGVSWLAYARRQLAIRRAEVWQAILKAPTNRPSEPSLLFDFCKDLEGVFPLLKEKHIAFLLDDYSNQRIPTELQRLLNQTISFAKHGNPIFKVSSEYQGVDLEGIQEGREVIEVNLGKEYVDLTDRDRSFFLEDVLNIRFKQAAAATTIEDLLGRSGISPAIPMARAIREDSAPGGTKFYYHGIDTVADICSGDLAMALDLVKQIYVQVKHQLPLREPVTPRQQHDVIREYSDREHMYIRYYSRYGKEMSQIVDSLCSLANKAAVMCESVKDGKREPMVKTHLDISSEAVRKLPPEMLQLLLEMEKKGILFSLDASRSRIESRVTERYQVRRILLTKYIAPLGRRDPIKLDNEQKLLYFLKEPKEFAEEEITGQRKIKFQ